MIAEQKIIVQLDKNKKNWIRHDRIISNPQISEKVLDSESVTLLVDTWPGNFNTGQNYADWILCPVCNIWDEVTAARNDRNLASLVWQTWRDSVWTRRSSSPCSYQLDQCCSQNTQTLSVPPDIQKTISLRITREAESSLFVGHQFQLRC